jgi:hypothetical protein
MFEGIYVPFDAGSPSMVLQGKTLVVHMSRTMFEHDDGLHHQSNMTFEVDTKTMKVQTFSDADKSAPYSSHSFNQFVETSGNDLVFADHGDAFPRGISLGIIKDYANGGAYVLQTNIFSFVGEIGDNYTGATVTGLKTGSGKALVVGSSVPQGKAIEGITGNSYSFMQNIYLVSNNIDTGKSTIKWLTVNSPKGKVNVTEPRIIKLDEDKFVILYNTIKSNTYTMQYKLVDSNGSVLKSASWPGSRFTAGSQPILVGSKIYWAGTASNAGSYLYMLDVTNPITPVLAP